MILYRIAQNPHPNPVDFMSQGAQGRRCPDPSFVREWTDGVSVFDDLAHAVAKAVRAPALGKYVFALDIPANSGLEIPQTFRDRHHYTIYAQGETLLKFVLGSAFPVERQ